MTATVKVSGLIELQRALKGLEKSVRRELRGELRDVAKPVADDAAAKSLNDIRNMQETPEWSRMRVGVTQSAVYIVPRQKRRGGNLGSRRPNLGNLLLREMTAALEENETRTTESFENWLGRLAAKVN
jgi:hypothetical protein